MSTATTSTTTSTTIRRALTAIAVIATGISVAACSPTGSSGGGGGGSNKLHTLTAGQLKIAFRADDKPNSFVQDGKPAGFLIDLMSDVARRAGQKPQFVSTDFDSILPGVKNHTYDTAAFGTIVTPERTKVAAFTTATLYGQAQLVSKRSKAVPSVQAAGGKTVAITTGSALIPLLQKDVPTVKIKQFPNVAASANALTAGQVDGLFTGVQTVSSLLAQHKDFSASEKISTGEDAFPVAKDRKALLVEMNTALKQIMTDGTYTKLFAKWFPASITISPQMLAAYPGLKQRSDG